MDDRDQQLRQQKLIELCYLLVEQHKAEQANDRAQWQVSYYRKPKVKASKAWSNPVKYSQKLEQVRLYALQKNKQMVEIKLRVVESMLKTKGELSASFLYGENGRITGIWLPDIENKARRGVEFDMSKIFELIDQHEADTTLTEALEDNKDYATSM